MGSSLPRSNRHEKTHTSPEPETSTESAPSPPEEALYRRDMRTGIVEGVFASTSDNLVAPYVALFALALGASHFQIGLVSAVPALIGAWIQLPAAWLAEKMQRRKLLMVIGGTGARILWIPMAAIPFLNLSVDSAVFAFIALLALRSFFAAMATPTWTSMIADMIPRGMRGRYFANRNVYTTIAALAATIGSGILLRLFHPDIGYQVVFVVAALFGFGGGYYLMQFPDLDAKGREEAKARRRSLATLPTQPVGETEQVGEGTVEKPAERAAAAGLAVTDAGGEAPVTTDDGAPPSRRRSWLRGGNAFVAFAIMAFVWNLGVNLPAPLFSVHFVETLGGTAGFWGIVTAATFVTTIIGQRYWGPLSDRLGGRAVMIVSGVLAAIIPALWLVASRPSAGIWINLVSGFGWAGYNLAAFNMLLEVTPDNRRSVFVAGYNGVIGISQFAGPLIGGLMADWISVPFVFGLSTVIRFVGWSMLLWMIHAATDQPFKLRDFWPNMTVRQLLYWVRMLPTTAATRWRIRRQERFYREKAKRRWRQTHMRF